MPWGALSTNTGRRGFGHGCPRVQAEEGCQGEVRNGSPKRRRGVARWLSSQALLSAGRNGPVQRQARCPVRGSALSFGRGRPPPLGLTWSGWSRSAAVRRFPPLSARGVREGGGGEPVVEVPRSRRRALLSPPGLLCPWWGPFLAVCSPPAPRAYPPHAADCLGSRKAIMECGAIGPVLKHGPRSYTLPRVEGARSPAKEALPAPDAQRKQVSLGQRARASPVTGGCLQRGPLALGLVPWGPGRLSDRAYTREATTYAKPG